MAPNLVVVLSLVALALDLRSSAQVIRLRHPESSSTATNLLFNPSLLSASHKQGQESRPNPRPADGRFTNDRPPSSLLLASQEAARRRTPRPGNVLVRFDSNHDIERIQYVLQDGQLATIFRREQLGDVGPKQEDEQQTIVSRQAQQEMAEQHSLLTLEAHQLDDEAVRGDAQSDTDQILASLAHDALAAQAQNSNSALKTKSDKLRKFANFLSKLKTKIKSKLQLLPQMVEKKLNAKSSNGRLFVDGEDGEPVPIELESEQHQEMLNKPIGGLQLRQNPQEK